MVEKNKSILKIQKNGYENYIVFTFPNKYLSTDVNNLLKEKKKGIKLP